MTDIAQSLPAPTCQHLLRSGLDALHDILLTSAYSKLTSAITGSARYLCYGVKIVAPNYSKFMARATQSGHRVPEQ